MQKKLHRLFLTLQTLPYAPRKISTSEIQCHLSAAGHEVSLRSVQRDLDSLSGSFPITSDNAKPAGWCWSKNATAMGVPALDPHSALVLQLARKHLERLLPVATLEHLAPQFRQSAETLEAYGNGLRKWPSKVRVLPRGAMLATPKINANVQSVIYESLLKDKKVKVRYRPHLDKIKDYEINPLGLIIRDRVAYLICTMWDYTEPRQLLLHRIVSAEMLDMSSQCPDEFDLDTYILQGEMSFPTGGKIQLSFELNEYAARQLRDCPLSADQRISETEGNNEDVIIEATVQDSMELRWWLLSFGDEAKILEPLDLREWFKETAHNMNNYYFYDATPPTETG